MTSNNSIVELNSLIAQYNVNLLNLNNDFHNQASNLYLNIASNVIPIYNSLQSNEDHLEKITNLLYVRNYYLTNNKQSEADMITFNMSNSWQPLQKSKVDICNFLGVDPGTNTMNLITSVTALGKLIPGELLGGLNNVIIYLNKLHTYDQLVSSNILIIGSNISIRN